MKTAEIIEKYVAHVDLKYKSIATRKIYKTRMYQFTDEHSELHRISSTELKRYLFSIKEMDLSDSYFNQMLAALHVIYDIILNQPRKLNNIEYKKSKKNHWQVLTVEEVAKMILATKNRKHKMIIKLLYVLGVRSSELLNLRLKDIDRSNKQIFVRAGKGSNDRAIDIDSAMITQLELYWKEYKPGEYIIENQNGNKYSKSSVNKILKKHEKSIGKKIWPHLLRHSIASHMINRDVSIMKLKDFLGHKNIKTTEHYYQYIKNDGMLSPDQEFICKVA